MADGATTSAPALASDTAVRASSGSVASLSTDASRITPQWPCEVYSQRQTSATMASSSPPERRSSAMARCTMPSSVHAPEPSASFVSGSPNRRTDVTPAWSSRSASRASSSTLSRCWSGMEAIGSRTPVPGRTKRGCISIDGCSRVSRTRARSEAVRRRRRPRKAPAAAVIGSVSRVIGPLVRSGRRWHRPGRMRCARPRRRRR